MPSPRGVTSRTTGLRGIGIGASGACGAWTGYVCAAWGAGGGGNVGFVDAGDGSRLAKPCDVVAGPMPRAVEAADDSVSGSIIMVAACAASCGIAGRVAGSGGMGGNGCCARGGSTTSVGDCGVVNGGSGASPAGGGTLGARRDGGAGGTTDEP